MPELRAAVFRAARSGADAAVRIMRDGMFLLVELAIGRVRDIVKDSFRRRLATIRVVRAGGGGADNGRGAGMKFPLRIIDPFETTDSTR